MGGPPGAFRRRAVDEIRSDRHSCARRFLSSDDLCGSVTESGLFWDWRSERVVLPWARCSPCVLLTCAIPAEAAAAVVAVLLSRPAKTWGVSESGPVRAKLADNEDVILQLKDVPHYCLKKNKSIGLDISEDYI
ncbi:hypothetical protein chiPu_0029599 [Chiloscyllium punctatum]|uniref:Uncharacterized protein n=1 Tax=Chiloscyllium punctatum TaxID=137246 RepID=A0A401TT39_CHIPU|nr:hypothetical protein [Chiloscyllium punctatum]